MKLNDSAWISLTTLCLAVACGPSTPGVGGGSGSTGEDTGSTSDASATNPTATNPNPTVPTGADTTATTTTATSGTTDATATATDDTTGDPPGSNSCCDVADTPGCNDPEVLDCVCTGNAECCAFEWSEECVEAAIEICDAVCEDPTGGTDTTGNPGDACDEIVTFEMLPSEATYNGSWSQGMSMVGEGEISVIQGGMDGSFVYEPDIPCDDTWYIWSRVFEQGNDDSYFATLDGEPMPEAIFEGGCDGAGQGYIWAQLNWRDQGDDPCVYIEDPWAPQWDAGLHQIEFSFRESPAMGRILITNDDTLVPM